MNQTKQGLLFYRIITLQTLFSCFLRFWGHIARDDNSWPIQCEFRARNSMEYVETYIQKNSILTQLHPLFIHIKQRHIQNPVKHLKWSFFWGNSYFCKRLHLRYLTGFWMFIKFVEMFMKKKITSHVYKTSYFIETLYSYHKRFFWSSKVVRNNDPHFPNNIMSLFYFFIKLFITV